MSNLIRRAVHSCGILFVFIFALISCKPPGTEPEPGPASDLLPPDRVDVAMVPDTNELRITWTAVDGASGDVRYDVFRSEAGGDPAQITASGLNSTMYQDGAYPLGKEIMYRVRSVEGAQVSALSSPSLAMTVLTSELAVANARATVLKYLDRIRVSWSPITQGEVTPEYTLRRFLSKSNINPEASVNDQSEFHEALDGSIYYDDNAVLENTAYYYQIDWDDAGTSTPGADGKFAFGLRCLSDDYAYEPNDNRNLLPVETTQVPQGKALTAFKFMDAGVTDQDTDWYKYRGEPRLVIVTVTLPNGSPLSGNLQFDYYYNGIYTTGNPMIEGDTLQIFDLDAFGESPPPVVDLFFRIRPTDPATNMIGTYSLAMKFTY